MVAPRPSGGGAGAPPPAVGAARPGGSIGSSARRRPAGRRRKGASGRAAQTRRGEGESRKAILDEAARLATVEGIEGLSIGRLADRVGISKSGLFAHFGSKEELQLATVETASALFAAQVIEPASDAPSGLERLHRLVDGYLRYVEIDTFPGGCFFASVLAEMDMRPGAVRDRLVPSSATGSGGSRRRSATPRPRGRSTRRRTPGSSPSRSRRRCSSPTRSSWSCAVRNRSSGPARQSRAGSPPRLPARRRRRQRGGAAAPALHALPPKAEGVAGPRTVAQYQPSPG